MRVYVCVWVTSMIFLGKVESNLRSCSQWEMSSWNTSQAAWATALFSNWTNKQGDKTRTNQWYRGFCFLMFTSTISTTDVKAIFYFLNILYDLPKSLFICNKVIALLVRESVASSKEKLYEDARINWEGESSIWKTATIKKKQP